VSGDCYIQSFAAPNVRQQHSYRPEQVNAQIVYAEVVRRRQAGAATVTVGPYASDLRREEEKKRRREEEKKRRREEEKKRRGVGCHIRRGKWVWVNWRLQLTEHIMILHCR
jgi:hypothetical protein